MGHIALIADLLVQVEPQLQQFRREDQRVQYVEFTTRWGRMHPLESLERYQKEIARHPDGAELHIGYGNVLKFLGRTDQAEAEYRHAGELDPENPHVWHNLAELAADRGDYAGAIRLWQWVLEVASRSKLPARERRLFLEVARDNIKALRKGHAGPATLEYFITVSPHTAQNKSAALPLRSARPSQAKPPKVTPPAAQPSGPIPRVGRNQPCPCGSGKKYKHCHGRHAK